MTSRVSRDRGRTAFTLVELLLVLAIVGVATAVTLPNLVRSTRGNRMRAAARTVVMAGRYARSMAVLRQQPVTLEFAIGAGNAPSRITVFVDDSQPLERVLDRVRIEFVELSGGDSALREGAAQVVYESNGRCDPYRVGLLDTEGERVTVDVDGLAGARTERRG